MAPGTWQAGWGLCECVRVECKLVARGDCGVSAVRGPAVWLASWAAPHRWCTPPVRSEQPPLLPQCQGPRPCPSAALGYCSEAGASPLAHPHGLVLHIYLHAAEVRGHLCLQKDGGRKGDRQKGIVNPGSARGPWSSPRLWAPGGLRPPAAR